MQWASSPPPRFAAARGYAIPAAPVSVGIADMTGEGLPDIVSASQGSVVSLLRNRGHRSFSAALNVPTGSDGEALTGSVISDLNSDGFPDVASVSVNVPI